MYSNPTIIKGETIPISNNMESSIQQQPISDIAPAATTTALVPEQVIQQPQPHLSHHHGRFFDSFRKRMREAAGIDNPFVNPYLGNGHPSTMMPPYGKQIITTESPEYDDDDNRNPTSSFTPPTLFPHMLPSSSLWNTNYNPYLYQQQQYNPMAMMMYGMGGGMSMYNNPMAMMMMNNNYSAGFNNNYYNALNYNPYSAYGNPIDLYYSSQNNMFNNPYSYGAYPSLGGYPYYVSALPVQDKRLLPERNLISSVKDIWQTNLR
ncbi:unnamed protein product [Cunninghamella blakesleeana]